MGNPKHHVPDWDIKQQLERFTSTQSTRLEQQGPGFKLISSTAGGEDQRIEEILVPGYCCIPIWIRIQLSYFSGKKTCTPLSASKARTLMRSPLPAKAIMMMKQMINQTRNVSYHNCLMKWISKQVIKVQPSLT
jgi:hypothetical protein